MMSITDRLSLERLRPCAETADRAGFLALGWGFGYTTAVDAFGGEGIPLAAGLMIAFGFVLLAYARYRERRS